MYIAFPSFIFRFPRIAFSDLSITLYDNDSLLDKLSTPYFQECIYAASPVLYDELQKLLNKKITKNEDLNRIIYSSVRYLSRMSTRCTPFGLFAGCCIGKIKGDKTSIILEESLCRTTRLDMLYISALYDAIIKIPEIKENIRFFPNTSLYKVGTKYRYVETLYIGTRRKYQITEIEKSSYLNKILKTAENGINIKGLINLLVCEEITEQEAIEFVNELINSQVITPELYQSVTGEDLLSRIIQLLEERLPADINLLGQLKRIKALLEKMDTDENALGLYQQVISIIKGMRIPYEEKFLFQIDMGRETSFTFLGSEIMKELESAMVFLNKITPPGRNEQLNKFKQDFYNRYEEREISLMEALDPEMGIGYPSNSNLSTEPLLDNLNFPLSSSYNNQDYNSLQSFLFHKITDYSSLNKKEIILTEEDFKGLKDNWDDLPPTIYTLFEIIRGDKESPLIRLKSCGGSSAANLLGRFSHTDPKIEQFVKEITNKEQEIFTDVILAEVVHSPEARVGNILSRPHLREYEILYMSDSDLPRDRLLPLSDLMLSVKWGELVIRSKRLNKKILPRLTTAHNYHYPGTMPVYRFLCDMQVQTGRNHLYFSWGQQLEKELSFLPRVRYKNVILSSATWIIKVEDLKSFFAIKDNNNLMEGIKKWREALFLPRYVVMPDNDNELYVDLENPLSVRSLFSIIKNRQSVKFMEFLFEPENAVIKDCNGSYTNEFIVAFHKS